MRAANPSLMPPGFSDPTSAPKKVDAKQLLLTLGIETVEEPSGLRVVAVKPDRAGRFDLQPDDIIENINNKKPSNLSGDSFAELSLTVKRQNQRVEIRTKP